MSNKVYKTNRHSRYLLQYHLVVVTKYRNPVLSKDILKRLNDICHNIFEKHWECRLIEVNGAKDHIHLLFEAPPQIRLSDLVNNFKTVSARLIRKEFPNEIKKFFWEPYLWSRSYFISTVGDVDSEIIKKYIKNQKG